MSTNAGVRGIAIALLALTGLGVGPVLAQGRGQGTKRHEEGKPKVTVELALSAARDVLVNKGFEVVRVEVKGDSRIIYYRAGNRGRGRGHGPPARMVIRRADDGVVLEDAPDAIRLEIGIKLGIRL